MNSKTLIIVLIVLISSDADLMEVNKIYKEEKDYERGMKELLKLREKGEPLAMVHLYMAYNEGL